MAKITVGDRTLDFSEIPVESREKAAKAFLAQYSSAGDIEVGGRPLNLQDIPEESRVKALLATVDVPEATSKPAAFVEGAMSTLPGLSLATSRDTIDFSGGKPGGLFGEKKGFVPLADRNTVTRAITRAPEVLSNLVTGERPIIPEPDTIDTPALKKLPSKNPDLIAIRDAQDRAKESAPGTYKAGQVAGVITQVALGSQLLKTPKGVKLGVKVVDDAVVAIQKGAGTPGQKQAVRFIIDALEKGVKDQKIYEGIINKYLVSPGAKQIVLSDPMKIKALVGASKIFKSVADMALKASAGAGVGAATSGISATMSGDEDIGEAIVKGAKRGAVAGVMSKGIGGSLRNSAGLELLMRLWSGASGDTQKGGER